MAAAAAPALARCCRRASVDGWGADDDCRDGNDAGSQSPTTSSAVVERLRLTIDG